MIGCEPGKSDYCNEYIVVGLKSTTRGEKGRSLLILLCHNLGVRYVGNLFFQTELLRVKSSGFDSFNPICPNAQDI
jgi:hypothetical protein